MQPLVKSILSYYFGVKKNKRIMIYKWSGCRSSHFIFYTSKFKKKKTIVKLDQLYLLFRSCGWANSMQWNCPWKRCRWISYYQYWKTVPWSAFSHTCHCQCCLGNNQKNRLVICGLQDVGAKSQTENLCIALMEPLQSHRVCRKI